MLAEQRLCALLAAFPRLGSFWAATWQQCQKQGWVASVAGRRFHHPSSASKDPQVNLLHTQPCNSVDPMAPTFKVPAIHEKYLVGRAGRKTGLAQSWRHTSYTFHCCTSDCIVHTDQRKSAQSQYSLELVQCTAPQHQPVLGVLVVVWQLCQCCNAWFPPDLAGSLDHLRPILVVSALSISVH